MKITKEQQSIIYMIMILSIIIFGGAIAGYMYFDEIKQFLYEGVNGGTTD